MFTSSLTEEVKALEQEIEVVKDKVDDPIMCAKIRQFVYAPREIQSMFKADAGKTLRCHVFPALTICYSGRRNESYHNRSTVLRGTRALSSANASPRTCAQSPRNIFEAERGSGRLGRR